METLTVEVEWIRLDDFLARNNGQAPALIKIDIEGAELLAPRGMSRTLSLPGVALMVEVTENGNVAFQLLEVAGYRLFNEHRRELVNADEMLGDIFCIQHGDSCLQVMERSAAA